jgi:hypothetical protein
MKIRLVVQTKREAALVTVVEQTFSCSIAVLMRRKWIAEEIQSAKEHGYTITITFTE